MRKQEDIIFKMVTGIFYCRATMIRTSARLPSTMLSQRTPGSGPAI